MQPLFLTSGGISECASSTGPLEISTAWQDPKICQFAPHPLTPDCLTELCQRELLFACSLGALSMMPSVCWTGVVS